MMLAIIYGIGVGIHEYDKMLILGKVRPNLIVRRPSDEGVQWGINFLPIHDGQR